MIVPSDDQHARPFVERAQTCRGNCFDGMVDACVPCPSDQDWWIVNTSDEAHNFHIHQTRFHLLKVRGARGFSHRSHSRWSTTIPFSQAKPSRFGYRPKQIRSFVHHGHFLEHEDKGMMSAMEVRRLD